MAMKKRGDGRQVMRRTPARCAGNGAQVTARHEGPARSWWSFRREVTLGHLLQIGSLLIILAAGWSNLQKDLALIRHDLTQLIAATDRLQMNLDRLSEQSREHDYRLRRLEERQRPGLTQAGLERGKTVSAGNGAGKEQRV